MDNRLLEKIAEKVSSKLGVKADVPEIAKHLSDIFVGQELFKSVLENHGIKTVDVDDPYRVAHLVVAVKKSIDEFCKSNRHRSDLTSNLISEAIRNIDFHYNGDIPALSKVEIKLEYLKKIEALKHYTFCSLIESPPLKVVEYRGKEIVGAIFEALTQGRAGHSLLPDDYKILHEAEDDKNKNRVICDFIAGMTDRYAIEFYGRLTSENPQTIFKPF